MLSESVKAELTEIVNRNGGKIRRKDVVRYAQENPESACHKEIFKDDDSVAAMKWRLTLAGKMIRVWYERMPEINKDVRVMISPPSQRVTLGAYVRTRDVVVDRHMRREMVEEALMKVKQLRNSYAYLPEMVPFFDRMDAIIADFREELDQRAHAG